MTVGDDILLICPACMGRLMFPFRGRKLADGCKPIEYTFECPRCRETIHVRASASVRLVAYQAWEHAER